MENNSTSQTSRVFPTNFAPDAFRPVLTFLALVGAVAVLIVVLFAGIVAWMATHGADLAGTMRAVNGIYGIEIQSAGEIAVVLYFLLVLPALARGSLRDLGFRAFRVTQLQLVAGAIVAMFVLVTLLGSIFENALHVKGSEAAVKMFLTLRSTNRVLFAVFAIIVGPLAEEFFFRLFLFNAMKQWWGFWTAAFVSSIFFGLSHMQPGGIALNVSLVVPLAVGGLILASVYERTRNAWANIITHGCFNGLSLLLILVAPQLAK